MNGHCSILKCPKTLNSKRKNLRCAITVRWCLGIGWCFHILWSKRCCPTTLHCTTNSRLACWPVVRCQYGYFTSFSLMTLIKLITCPFSQCDLHDVCACAWCVQNECAVHCVARWISNAHAPCILPARRALCVCVWVNVVENSVVKWFSFRTLLCLNAIELIIMIIIIIFHILRLKSQHSCVCECTHLCHKQN